MPWCRKCRWFTEQTEQIGWHISKSVRCGAVELIEQTGGKDIASTLANYLAKNASLRLVRKCKKCGNVLRDEKCKANLLFTKT